MRRWGLMLLMLAIVLFASCKQATQVNVVLRTNVLYTAGTEVAMWSSRSGTIGSPLVETGDPWLADGEVGNAVVVPGDAAKDSSLTVRVAMGLRGKRATACTDEANSADCIIARRKLAFVPHTPLKVPVVMYLACEGVKCTPDTTCNYLGQCVPAQVDPAACATPEGCSLPGEPPFVAGQVSDAGTDAAPDISSDSLADGAADAVADASTDAANDAGAGQRALDITAGGFHTCARFEDGSVKCWGRNTEGQLGLGDTQDRGDGPGEMNAALPTVDLGPGRIAQQLVAGTTHTCARLDNGSVKCWGENLVGQLGLGDTQSRGDGPGEMGAVLPSVDLGPGRIALQLVSGASHTCAQLDNGSVKCWGANVIGALGLGDIQNRGDGPGEMGAALPAVDLGPGRTPQQLTAGNSHACATLDDQSLKCWGFNSGGQLGLGDVLPRGTGPGEMGAALLAVDLGPGLVAQEVAAGSLHTCARLATGAIKCWGFGNFGTLGYGDTLIRGAGAGSMGAALPLVDLGPGRSALQIVAGDTHTCARLDDNSVKCWGQNTAGRLGLGDALDRGDGPGEMGAALPAVDLGPGKSVLQVVAGGFHTCARLNDASVKCWGRNDRGQLGLGDTVDRGGGAGEMGAQLPSVQLK